MNMTVQKLQDSIEAKKTRRNELQRELNQTREQLQTARRANIEGDTGAADTVASAQAKITALGDTIGELDKWIEELSAQLSAALKSETTNAVEAANGAALASYDAALADADNCLRDWFNDVFSTKIARLQQAASRVSEAERDLANAGLLNPYKIGQVQHNRPHGEIRHFWPKLEFYVLGQAGMNQKYRAPKITPPLAPEPQPFAPLPTSSGFPRGFARPEPRDIFQNERANQLRAEEQRRLAESD